MTVSGRLARNSFFQLWANMVTLGSSLFLSVALARGLGPEQYGSYVFYIWLLGTGVMLANLGLNSMSNKFIAEYEGAGDQHAVHGVLQIALWLRAAAALVIAIALVPISMLLVGDAEGSSVRFYPLLVSLALVPYALLQGLQGVLRGFQRYDYASYPLFVVLPVKTLMAVVLIHMGYGVMHLLVLEAITWTIAAAGGLLFLRRHVGGTRAEAGPRLSKEAKVNMSRFAAVAMVLLLVDFVVNQRSEIFFLSLYRSSEEVGYYNLAFSVAIYPMMMIPGALGQVLMPAISEQFGRRDMDRIASIYVNSARYLMLLAFPMSAGAIVMARPIIITLFGGEYSEAVLPAQIMFAGACLYPISLSTSSMIYGTNRPLFILLLSLFMVPANLIAAVVLIPHYGVVGAALAKAAVAPAFPVAVWYVSTRLKVGWPYKDTARIVVACVVMAVAVAALRFYLQATWLIPVVVLLGAMLYVTLVLLLRILRSEDLELVAPLWSRSRFAGWLGRSFLSNIPALVRNRSVTRP